MKLKVLIAVLFGWILINPVQAKKKSFELKSLVILKDLKSDGKLIGNWVYKNLLILLDKSYKNKAEIMLGLGSLLILRALYHRLSFNEEIVVGMKAINDCFRDNTSGHYVVIQSETDDGIIFNNEENIKESLSLAIKGGIVALIGWLLKK